MVKRMSNYKPINLLRKSKNLLRLGSTSLKMMSPKDSSRCLPSYENVKSSACSENGKSLLSSVLSKRTLGSVPSWRTAFPNHTSKQSWPVTCKRPPGREFCPLSFVFPAWNKDRMAGAPSHFMILRMWTERREETGGLVVVCRCHSSILSSVLICAGEEFPSCLSDQSQVHRQHHFRVAPH